jgi:hypothetical protein
LPCGSRMPDFNVTVTRAFIRWLRLAPVLAHAVQACSFWPAPLRPLLKVSP